jgi:hypothetical protein
MLSLQLQKFLTPDFEEKFGNSPTFPLVGFHDGARMATTNATNKTVAMIIFSMLPQNA